MPATLRQDYPSHGRHNRHAIFRQLAHIKGGTLNDVLFDCAVCPYRQCYYSLHRYRNSTLILSMFRRAKSVEQIRLMIDLITITDRMGVRGSLLTIASGLYLALTTWSLRTGWISASLGAIILLVGPLMGGVIEPRTRSLIKLANEMPDGPLPQLLDVRIHDSILGIALQTNLAVVIGIVFIMTTKPSLIVSVAVIGIVTLLGALSGVLLRNPDRRGHRSST